MPRKSKKQLEAEAAAKAAAEAAEAEKGAEGTEASEPEENAAEEDAEAAMPASESEVTCVANWSLKHDGKLYEAGDEVTDTVDKLGHLIGPGKVLKLKK